MRTVEDRLDALSTAPAPVPPRPAVHHLRDRARARARRRRRASTAAGALAAASVAVAVAVAVVVWSGVAGTDATRDVVAGPGVDEPTGDAGDPRDRGEAGDRAIAPLDDPVDLAHEALQRYGNDRPPAAVRIGRVDAASFRAWQREHTGGYGPADDRSTGGTLTVLLVRTSGGGLWAPHPPPGSSGELDGDTVYVVFAGGLSPEGARASSSGTAAWSDVTTTAWAQDLQEIDVD